MKRKEFERIVEEAVRGLPGAVREKIENVVFVVADEPTGEQIEEYGDLYGLYEGTPFPERGPDAGPALPDRVWIFKHPIEEDCETREEMIETIQDTVLHEVGHYFGLDEDDLEELGIG